MAARKFDEQPTLNLTPVEVIREPIRLLDGCRFHDGKVKLEMRFPNETVNPDVSFNEITWQQGDRLDVSATNRTWTNIPGTGAG